MDKDKLQPLEKLLKPGKENAITRDQLAAYYGLTLRALDDLVARKRKEGIPILAKKWGGGGLYLPRDIDEIYEYNRNILKEVRSRLEVRSALNKCIDDLTTDGSNQQLFTFMSV